MIKSFNFYYDKEFKLSNINIRFKIFSFDLFAKKLIFLIRLNLPFPNDVNN